MPSPDPSRCLPEFQETVEVASNPVVPEVTLQLLRKLLVLLLDRVMEMLLTPVR